MKAISASEAFAILEIDEETSFEDAKRKYRLLLGDLHPDKHNSLDDRQREIFEERTIELNRAWQIVKNHYHSCNRPRPKQQGDRKDYSMANARRSNDTYAMNESMKSNDEKNRRGEAKNSNETTSDKKGNIKSTNHRRIHSFSLSSSLRFVLVIMAVLLCVFVINSYIGTLKSNSLAPVIERFFKAIIVDNLFIFLAGLLIGLSEVIFAVLLIGALVILLWGPILCLGIIGVALLVANSLFS